MVCQKEGATYIYRFTWGKANSDMAKGKNIIVGQSGGPTAVINASLAGVAAAARGGGGKLYGMRHGVQGLEREEVTELGPLLQSEGALTLLQTTPAAFLGSSALISRGSPQIPS